MLELLKPSLYLNRLIDIPLEDLVGNGIAGLIIDLDNTITEWNSFELEKEIKAWFDKLPSYGLKTCLVSNNNYRRVEQVAKRLNTPFICNARKPSRKGFIKAMEVLSTSNRTTAVVGDQVFTDVLGGNRLGLYTILVKPLTKREFIGTRCTRQLEKVVLSRIIKHEPSR